MRASIIRCAMVAATILAMTGCRSGTSYSPWNWGWGRKNQASGPAMNANDAGPQLPSASATPPNYGATVQTPASPGYPDTGASAYQPASYAGQPAGYANPASGGMPNAAAAGGYAASPNAATPYATPPTAAPQSGPYNESYGQPAAVAGNPYGGAGAAGYPTSNPQNTPYPPSGSYGQTAPAQNPAYPPSADPYASAVSPAGAAAAPADPYQTAPAGNAYGNGPAAASGAYSTADNRSEGDRYATPPIQTEQAAADRYATTSNEPPGQPAQGASGAAPYQPGNTGYNPGNTGYSPPGVAPYQMPTQPDVPSAPRRDPYFRPGGTSDYLPGGGVQSPAAPAATDDRYGTPMAPTGAAVDPYAPPAGSYQTPAGY